MAGIALIFSMAETMKVKPPMIMMDEIDAHLDEDNITKLSSFIKSWQQGPLGRETQIIMISHKENMIKTADSLIGVSQQEYSPLEDQETEAVQDVAQGADQGKPVSAVTYSMDLRNY